MLPSFALFIALAGADPSVPAEFETCRPEALAALERVGIPQADLLRIESVPERTFSVGDDRITGYSVWSRVRGCSGQVVVVFNRWCRPLRFYGTGDCEVPRP